MLYGIGQHEIEAVWPEVEPWIDGSAKRTRGKYTAEDIRTGLLNGDAQLWIWKTPTAFGVIVTQIEVYPQRKCLCVRVGTGTNAQEWAQPAAKRLEEFARYAGCKGVLMVTRPGWEKLLPEYDRTHVYLEKEL
ncbi:MAG: hypothetical protein QJR04_25210 [Burkholderia multivorans]|nr:hypothetical protein [Burkholderia multivorans]